MNIYILGGEGNGTVVAASVFRKYPNSNISFINDVDSPGTQIGKYKKKIEVVGNIKEIEKLNKDKKALFISAFAGFNNPQKSMKCLIECESKISNWMTFIDDSSIVPIEFCNLGFDIFIGPLSQISPNVSIGNHTSIFGNAFVGHDTIIGNFCHLTSNCVVGSRVNIGDGVHIGLNSTIREGVKVGNNSIIGAGAIVLNDVPENAVVVGNPAKVIKYRDNNS